MTNNERYLSSAFLVVEEIDRFALSCFLLLLFLLSQDTLIYLFILSDSHSFLLSIHFLAFFFYDEFVALIFFSCLFYCGFLPALIFNFILFIYHDSYSISFLFWTYLLGHSKDKNTFSNALLNSFQNSHVNLLLEFLVSFLASRALYLSS